MSESLLIECHRPPTATDRPSSIWSETTTLCQGGVSLRRALLAKRADGGTLRARVAPATVPEILLRRAVENRVSEPRRVDQQPFGKVALQPV